MRDSKWSQSRNLKAISYPMFTSNMFNRSFFDKPLKLSNHLYKKIEDKNDGKDGYKY